LSVIGLGAALAIVKHVEGERYPLKTAIAYPTGLEVRLVEMERREYFRLAKDAIQSTLEALW
jgi:hypothetical protein